MKESSKAELLRQLPAVDELVDRPGVAAQVSEAGHELAVKVARALLDRLRQEIAGASEAVDADVARVEELLADELKAAVNYSLQPMVNATGVVLHTNLGRAPLGEKALKHLVETAGRYSNLEYDLAAGRRGKRDQHTGRLLASVTGAEAAIVVNNNAAAVYLVLNTLAEGGEVVVSRGELIEIGDGFRIPEIMVKSGAILREVGTTNRTRLADYENAVSERTRLVLRVHPSNFRMIGFVERPSLAELVALGAQRTLPVYEDLGSGCLAAAAQKGTFDEPTVEASLRAGVSVVSFSGDKLLGGPQAGILVGKKDLVERIRRNPMFRALRVDKLTVAALEATLLSYRRGAHDEVPALQMLLTTAAEIARRSEVFVARLRHHLGASPAHIEVQEGQSVMGGGSTPEQFLPTHLIAIASPHLGPPQLEARLRQHRPAILARIESDQLLLDLRTVFPDQEETLLRALVVALAP
ncbi:MAG TPA: L-seryl-tRNA(Sec) selenium transferase [Candidatus Acidoferrales bacterium]